MNTRLEPCTAVGSVERCLTSQSLWKFKSDRSGTLSSLLVCLACWRPCEVGQPRWKLFAVSTWVKHTSFPWCSVPPLGIYPREVKIRVYRNPQFNVQNSWNGKHAEFGEAEKCIVPRPHNVTLLSSDRHPAAARTCHGKGGSTRGHVPRTTHRVTRLHGVQGLATWIRRGRNRAFGRKGKEGNCPGWRRVCSPSCVRCSVGACKCANSEPGTEGRCFICMKTERENALCFSSCQLQCPALLPMDLPGLERPLGPASATYSFWPCDLGQAFGDRVPSVWTGEDPLCGSRIYG